MVVVKLGGSLAESSALRGWLHILVENGGGRAILVPGGGPFAEAVRAGQTMIGFSDRAAHRMAVLAMDQYALALADVEPRLTLCADAAAISAVLRRGGIALWLPAAMVLADPDIAESWDVTSDSLAAWLARRLGAGLLVLVKSVAAAGTPQALASAGVVDAAFPGYVAAARCDLLVVGPGESGRLGAALRAAA